MPTDIHIASHLSDRELLAFLLVLYECRLNPALFYSCTSSVSTGTRLRAVQTEFDSRQGQGFFLFAIATRPVLGLTQPPISWVPGALFPVVKLPGREADH
jgi:hypothetical protein